MFLVHDLASTIVLYDTPRLHNSLHNNLSGDNNLS